MNKEYLNYTCFAYRTFLFDKSVIFEGGADVPSGGEKADEDIESDLDSDAEPADKESVDKAAEEAKKKGDVMIEAGARIPVPPSQSEVTPDKVEEVDAIGGEVVARYVLTDPTKPYIALTFPLAADYRSISIVRTGAAVSSELADEVTITGGVGVEGGVPLGSVVTLYGGAGVEGGVQVYDYNVADSAGKSEVGTDVTPTVGAFGSAGLRVNPTASWHLYAGVKPTVSFTGGPGLRVPVVAGTGLSF